MNKYIIALIIGMFLLACGSVKNIGDEKNLSLLDDSEINCEMQKKGVNFYGTGNEDWELEIDFDKKVKFKSSKFDINFNVTVLTLGEGLKGSEAIHEVNGMDAKLTIDIKVNENYLKEDKSHPYIVKITYEKNHVKHQFNGGGQFYGAIRLHDIWVLEEINGEKVDASKSRKHPMMEIHLDKDRVMGFLGCNNFSGNIYFGRNQICFLPIASTKMACLNDRVEPEFAKALRSKTFNYRFEDLHLILENESDTLIFKKGI